MVIVRPVPYNIQSGQYVDSGAITQDLIRITQDINANAAPAVGNAAQTFAVANATVSNQAVNLGQLGGFSPLASASLAGTTAGSVTWAQYMQGALKAFAAQALNYENNTTNSQTITFPTPFVNAPVVTVNTTGLTVTASTTTLTITAPNNTTLYSGIIEVKGF
jgi:hypothetical protein